MCEVSILSRRPKKPTIAYKVYNFRRLPRQIDFKKGFKVYYVYRTGEETIQEGKVITSDRESSQLTSVEKAEGEVEKGIHTFTSLIGAKNEVNSNGNNAIILKVEISPEDLLGQGDFFGEKALVSHRIKFLEVTCIGVNLHDGIKFFGIEFLKLDDFNNRTKKKASDDL